MTPIKLDILAFSAHPDDVELSCSGTMIVHSLQGKKTGIVDLTRGEMGTRGTPEMREQEARKAAGILGLAVRENLGMEDCFFTVDKAHQLEIVKRIRKYKPEIILCNSIADRHPDHARASELVSKSVFMAGLLRLETNDEGKNQQPWKPAAVYHYIQDRYLKPDFVVDVTDVWEKRMEAVMAFRSQFYNPESNEPETAISSKAFLEFLASRAAEFGRPAGFRYAEGFTAERQIGVTSLYSLL